jgi:hypothetical protein
VNRHALKLEAVTTWQGGPFVATVNLSSQPLNGSGTTPLLETMSAQEPALRGRVFGFSTPPERQAHLIADALFPAPAPGTTAVIYTGSGVFADVVPAAIEHVLNARGVTPVRVPFDPAHPQVQVPAEAAFLSMDNAGARSWLRQFDAGAYPRGVGGIYPILDAGALNDMPASGVRLIAPYALPPEGEEAAALRNGTHMPMSASLIHGWVTAKSLALAIWLSDATTADAVTRALDRLDGYASGFMPPLETRPGTNARTPEGVLYEVRNGAFRTSDGTWRRDRY